MSENLQCAPWMPLDLSTLETGSSSSLQNTKNLARLQFAYPLHLYWEQKKAIGAFDEASKTSQWGFTEWLKQPSLLSCSSEWTFTWGLRVGCMDDWGSVMSAACRRCSPASCLPGQTWLGYRSCFSFDHHLFWGSSSLDCHPSSS
jgi:hypothetical protein